METNYLAHFRIGGEKSGKRRWQNQDGTWTEEGKDRRNAQYAAERAAYNARKTYDPYAGYRASKDIRDDKLLEKNVRFAQEAKFRANLKADAQAASEYAEMIDARERQATDAFNSSVSTISKTGESMYAEWKKKDSRVAKGKLYDAARQMSDEDLRRISDRLNLEKRYRDAVESSAKPSGKRSIEEIIALGVGGVTIATAAVKLVSSLKELAAVKQIKG